MNLTEQQHEINKKINAITMKIQETGLAGCYIISPDVFKDKRGFFFESFNQRKFEEATNIPVNFVQDNQSYSEYGVIRGLHAQAGDFAQAKLVSVLLGEVLDVVVDARSKSSTYGKHFALKLNAKDKKQLFVPRGFLHGFAVLSESAHFFYKCDNYYHKASEYGLMYNDPTLAIDWQIPEKERIISEKDQYLPLFS